ncbi:MAG: hypothetical protein U0L05_00840 [Schaedlerella sp.]|nr:hypothetical protein [Schaedlerella sp.]
MKCPICGKDVELRNRQVGVDEQGNPVFNQYAVCKDCKKQWNLDKKRAKKTTEKSEPVKKAVHEEPAPVKKTAVKKVTSEETAPVKKAASEEQAPVRKAAPKKQAPVKKVASEEAAPVRKAAPKKQAPVKKVTSEEAAPVRKAAPKKQASVKKVASEEAAPVRKAARPTSAKKGTAKTAPKKVSVEDAVTKKVTDKISANDNPYLTGNIPPKQVRMKSEQAMKEGYQEMLAADPKHPSRKKSKTPAKEVIKEVSNPVVQETDDYEEYESVARFRVLRVLFGIISILIAGFYGYNSYNNGLMDTTIGMTFLILAGCMGVAGLLLIILNGTNNIFAFLLPMILYLASGLYAFLNRNGETFLLYSAIIGAAFSVLFIILAISSRGDEEDYDDFDDDDDEDDDWDDDEE